MIVNFTAPKDMPPAQKATAIVHAYARMALDSSDPDVSFDVYIVWFVKALQNWKALVSTSLPDLTYYEVTYDGDRGRTYLDVYRKIQNITVMDEAVPLPPIPEPVDDREPTCVAKWPECHVGGYDPRCCRFPKSCSCWKDDEPAEGMSLTEKRDLHSHVFGKREVDNDTASERAEDRTADSVDEGR